MMQYPITMTPDDNGTILVTFPDFPEAATFGEDDDEARARAVDALETIIDAYIRERRPIPTPSPARSADVVTVPPLVAAKVQIYSAMQRQHVNKSTLAKRLNVHLPQIDRLLDLKHGSKIEQLAAAADALGGHLDVVLVMPEHESVDGIAFMKALQNASLRERRGTQLDAALPPVHAGVLARAKRPAARRSSAAKKK